MCKDCNQKRARGGEYSPNPKGDGTITIEEASNMLTISQTKPSQPIKTLKIRKSHFYPVVRYTNGNIWILSAVAGGNERQYYYELYDDSIEHKYILASFCALNLVNYVSKFYPEHIGGYEEGKALLSKSHASLAIFKITSQIEIKCL